MQAEQFNWSSAAGRESASSKPVDAGLAIVFGARREPLRPAFPFGPDVTAIVISRAAN